MIAGMGNIPKVFPSLALAELNDCRLEVILILFAPRIRWEKMGKNGDSAQMQ